MNEFQSKGKSKKKGVPLTDEQRVAREKFQEASRVAHDHFRSLFTRYGLTPDFHVNMLRDGSDPELCCVEFYDEDCAALLSLLAKVEGRTDA